METSFYSLIYEYKKVLLYPINVYFQNVIKDLIARNDALQGTNQQGFYCNGEFYFTDSYYRRRGHLLNIVDSSLEPEVMSIEEFRNTSENTAEELCTYFYSELPKFKEVVHKSVGVDQALRDFFPESLYKAYDSHAKELVISNQLEREGILARLPTKRLDDTFMLTLPKEVQDNLDTLLGYSLIL